MTHAQHVAKFGGKPLSRLCDCGRPATHSFAGPECDRCQKLRHERERHQNGEAHLHGRFQQATVNNYANLD